MSLNISAAVKQIKNINEDISKHGLYDVVVLDSVLNSITSLDYEDAVLTTCNALCDDDGIFFTSTRSLCSAKQQAKTMATYRNERKLQMMDNNGFCGTFRNGVWTFQKFNSYTQLKNLLSKYFDDVKVIDHGKSNMHAICKRPKRLSREAYRKALNAEFNIEYPDGYRHNKHTELVETILNCLRAS